MTLVIGLTGRVGSGKSYVANIVTGLADIRVIDLDRIGHELLKTHGIKESIRTHFGPAVFDADGEVSRPALGNLVFSSPAQLATLNKLMHPAIKTETLRLIAAEQTRPVIIAGALLHEIGLIPTCDLMVTLDATDAQIITAVGEKKFRIARSQRSRKAYAREADIILTNSFNPEFETTCKQLMTGLLKEAAPL